MRSPDSTDGIGTFYSSASSNSLASLASLRSRNSLSSLASCDSFYTAADWKEEFGEFSCGELSATILNTSIEDGDHRGHYLDASISVSSQSDWPQCLEQYLDQYSL